MIGQALICTGTSFDPYYNLAAEQVLLEQVRDGEIILYLWQNRHTVVIGRNQNAWKECRTEKLAADGGFLARRLSGGGAVYHDLGNLNFTFLMKEADHDVDRQLSVIMKAVGRYGITAEKSGRNDVLAAGRKFSGNAFYSSRGQYYHHGTLLVDADMEMLGRYLAPSKAKLAGKGVDSARGRVVNLRELAPDMTVDGLGAAMEDAFQEVYGLRAGRIAPEETDAEKLRAYRERNCSNDWLYGRRIPFSFSCGERFPWGGIELELQVDGGLVQGCSVYTDAMDHRLADELRKGMTGCSFSADALCCAVLRAEAAEDIRKDICGMIMRQDL